VSQALDYIEESVTAIIAKTAALTASLAMAAVMTENQPYILGAMAACWVTESVAAMIAKTAGHTNGRDDGCMLGIGCCDDGEPRGCALS